MVKRLLNTTSDEVVWTVKNHQIAMILMQQTKESILITSKGSLGQDAPLAITVNKSWQQNVFNKDKLETVPEERKPLIDSIKTIGLFDEKDEIEVHETEPEQE